MYLHSVLIVRSTHVYGVVQFLHHVSYWAWVIPMSILYHHLMCSQCCLHVSRLTVVFNVVPPYDYLSVCLSLDMRS